MKLSELIARVGDDNIKLQNLMHSSPDIQKLKKDSRISFYTDHEKAGDLMQQAVLGTAGKWTALIIWLPTDKLPGQEKQ